MDLPDLSLGLHGTHVVITGAAGAIGSNVVRHFLSAGCTVTALDINRDKISAFPKHPNLFWDVVDITDEQGMEDAFSAAVRERGVVAVCVALASIDYSFLPHHGSLTEMPVAQWRRTMEVNVTGTFITARAWLRQLREHGDAGGTRNVSLVIIGSEAAENGVMGNADYSAGKAAVQMGLVQSLTKDVVKIHPRGRVNAVAPGAVDTEQFRKECEEDPGTLWRAAQATVALGKPVPVDDVARAVLFLASERWSGSITGQVIRVDGGKMGKVQWMPGEIKQ
jgi:NAD(P)-dependent dehydrogenase (short-subunit alcohol dehydrogenase family)